MKLWLFTSILLVAGCGDDSNGVPAGPVAKFKLSDKMTALDVPYPNALYLKDGHVNLAGLPARPTADPAGVARLVEAVNEETGFGASTGVFFGYSTGTIDPHTLTDASAFLIDLNTGAKIPAQLHARDDDHTIVVAPRFGDVLLQNLTYGAVLTTAIKDTAGNSLRADADFAPTLANHAAYEPLRGWLDAHNVPRASVAAATVYQVHDVTAGDNALRVLIDVGQLPIPAVNAQLSYVGAARLDTLLGTTHPHSHIAAAINGTFASPYFLADSPQKLGHFSFDATGKPVQKTTVDIPYTLVLPAGQSLSNLKVVVFTHGIDAMRTDLFWFADDFCARGYAVIGIDTPFHGNRQIEANGRDLKNNFTDADGPDGFAETVASASGAEFLDEFGDANQPAFDPRASRDAFRQAHADLMMEARLVQEGDWSAVRALDASLANVSFRQDKLLYTSHSFGSIMGAALMAISPRYGAAVLVVGGGGLLFPLMQNSPNYGPKFEPPIQGYFGIDDAHRDPLVHPGQFLLEYALFQQVLELGDPIAYGPYVLQAGKHVLLLEAIDDESVPNHAAEALARAMGLHLLLHSMSPARGVTHVDPLPTDMVPLAGNISGLTAGLLQFDPATHGMYLNDSGTRHYDPMWPPLVPLAAPITVTNPTPAERHMALQFADTYFAGTAAPQVIDPFGP
jgi:hypothetical protein